jgi:hypothetical protein
MQGERGEPCELRRVPADPMGAWTVLLPFAVAAIFIQDELGSDVALGPSLLIW